MNTNPSVLAKRSSIVAVAAVLVGCASSSGDEAVGATEERLDAIPASNATKRTLGVNEWHVVPNASTLDIQGIGAGGVSLVGTQMNVDDGDDGSKHLTFDLLGDASGRFEMKTSRGVTLDATFRSWVEDRGGALARAGSSALLTVLEGPEQLRQRFMDSAKRPRLVLFLSPT